MRSLGPTFNQRYSEISHREKVIIFITGLIIISYLMVWFFILPMQTTYLSLEKQIKNFKQQEMASLRQLEEIQYALGQDYSKELINKERVIKKRIEQIDQQLNNVNLSFVTPNKMPLVLRQLLHKNEKIKLIHFKTHPAVPIYSHDKSRSKTSNSKKIKLSPQHINFYEHTMSLQIKGDYFSLLNYLKKVKQIKEKIKLKSLAYQVDTHPLGNLTLTISTVSSNDEFLEL